MSYSTIGNVKAIYNAHNKKVLSNKPKVSSVCKCSKTYRGIPKTCPIPTICNETDVVYKAVVTESSTNTKSVYYGLTQNKLKTRVKAHLSSFVKRCKKTTTTMSKHVHNIEDRGSGFDVDWTVERRTKHWAGGENCNLCLSEKTAILFSQEDNVLNQRKELYSKCPHRRAYEFKKTDESEEVLGDRSDEEQEEESEGDTDEEIFYDCSGDGDGNGEVRRGRNIRNGGNETETGVGRDSFSVNLFKKLQREKAVVKRRMYDDR